ncbi:hypothetical protein [Enorma sp.]|uniref:hypothetical protein n=1 Tax=Enorma sp. TaxID=1920692 RepID=UPI003AB12AEA
MYGMHIDTKKAQAIPASLEEWTGQGGKGPRALVAELASTEPAPTPEEAVYTVKGWTYACGPYARAAQLGIM